MNRILGALVLVVVIVVLLYVSFTKVMTLSAENETLKQNVLTLTQTNKAIEGINSLKNKGGEYEMLNTKYPDDPAINCVFQPSSAGCNPDGSRKGETTKVDN